VGVDRVKALAHPVRGRDWLRRVLHMGALLIVALGGCCRRYALDWAVAHVR